MTTQTSGEAGALSVSHVHGPVGVGPIRRASKWPYESKRDGLGREEAAKTEVKTGDTDFTFTFGTRDGCFRPLALLNE